MLVADVHTEPSSDPQVVLDQSLAAADVPHVEAAPEEVGAVRLQVGLTLVHQAVPQAQPVQPAQGRGGLADEDLGQFGVVAAAGDAFEVGSVVLRRVGGHRGDLVPRVRLDQV